ncbi:MAG TPA: hypothetical protein DEB09_02055 [Candidatus Magasanikbacteria bacterium]|nr:hypothetical protein [Candidatus Magasanikbacteria bacterium]
MGIRLVLNYSMRTKLILLLVVIIIFYPLPSSSIMSSTHYTILNDQIGMGAGISEGGVYSLRDSSGALISAGVVDGNTYEIRSGFYFGDNGTLSVTISPSTIDLGALNTSTVNTTETTITVNTDSETGYTLAVGSVSAGGLTDVSDGQVTAGSEEFGFVGTGDDCLLSASTSTAVTASLPIASHSSAINSSEINLVFQAAISNSTPPTASGQKNISFTASANFY